MKLEIEPFIETPETQDQSVPENGDGDQVNGEGNGSKENGASSTESANVWVGQDCEVKEYEARYNLKMERITKAVERKKEADEDEKESRKYAMRSYKYYAPNGELQSEEVEIHSPHIIKALQDTIKDYPGLTLSAEVLMISGNPRCIFHYRKEIAKYRDELNDGIAKLHVTLALDFMQREFRGSIKKYEILVERALSHPSIKPSIEFKDVWMVFKPGDLILAGTHEKLQLLKLDEVAYYGGTCPKWRIWGWYFTHDGQAFGYCQKSFDIASYEGSKPIEKLPILPLVYHPEAEDFRTQLLDRGKKFCSLKGAHHRSYHGIASALGDERDRNQYGAVDSYPLETTMVGAQKNPSCEWCS